MICLPETYNYIGVFLSFRCNLKCSYCINRYDQFEPKCIELDGESWVKALNNLETRPDLPVTIQGGEPTLHKDFYYIINNIKPEIPLDLLTNIKFDVDEFIRKVSKERIKRAAPYASIRVSYHPEVMDLEETFRKVLKLMEKGYHVGIWSLLYTTLEDKVFAARERALKLGIDFRFKEYLGYNEGVLHGNYKYPGALDKEHLKKVECRTTELLIGPTGSVFRCHSDLYAQRKPVSALTDKAFNIEDIYRSCEVFGLCNPCDVKVKTNRFQEFGHTSVDIRFSGK